MDPEALTNLLALVNAHKWVAVASIVVGLLVRMTKDDPIVAWFPVAIPARYRPLIAFGLGMISGALQKLAEGIDWPTALVGGAVSAALAMSAHAVVISSLRNGRELGEAKPGPAKPPLLPTLLLCLVLGGCAAVATLVTIADAVAIAAPYAAQVVGDIEAFADHYFAAHPDPVKAAEVKARLERAKLAALALGKLGAAGVDVSQQDYLDAIREFQAAYNDLYAALTSLPGVEVQAPSADVKKAAKPGTMLLIAPPPSAFAVKGGAS